MLQLDTHTYGMDAHTHTLNDRPGFLSIPSEHVRKVSHVLVSVLKRVSVSVPKASEHLAIL